MSRPGATPEPRDARGAAADLPAPPSGAAGEPPAPARPWWIALVVAGTALTSLYSYLLFHSLAELFSIVVACCLFSVAWNARRWMENDYLLLLGIAALFVGGVDTLHTLAFAGMPVFRGYDANLATSLWIVARATEAVSLCLAPRFLEPPRLRPRRALLAYAGVSAALVWAVFAGWFPECYREGVGLTPFKIGAEYAICLLLGAAAWLLHRHRARFAPQVLRLLFGAIGTLIASELAFTRYIGVYSLANLVGHLLKIVAFGLLYEAIIKTGLQAPYTLLFRSLVESEARQADRMRQLEAVRGVAEEITRELQLPRLLELIVRKAVELIGESAAGIFLWDEAAQRLLPAASTQRYPWLAEERLRKGEGLVGLVAAEGAGRIVNDYRSWPGASRLFLERSRIQAAIAEPLVYQGGLVGVLVVDDAGGGRRFTPEDQRLLSLLAAQAAIAIENARLHRAVAGRAEQLHRLNVLARTLTTALDRDQVAARTLDALEALFPHCIGQAWGWDPARQRLHLLGVRGDASALHRREFALGEGLVGLAAARREPLESADVQADPRFLNQALAQAAELAGARAIPLVHRDQLEGVLALFPRGAGALGAEAAELLAGLAAQAAVALGNARLYAAVQERAEELERRVRERTAELERALQIKIDFLARMSHELRTPLNAVVGFAELLREARAGSLTATQIRYADHILTGGRQLLDMVSDLLELSEAGGAPGELHRESIPLAPLAREVLGLFGVQAEQKRLRLEAEVPGELSVVAERRKLSRVLLNLVGNAVKFTPAGGSVTVTARAISDMQFSSCDLKGEEAELQSKIESRKSQIENCVEIAVADTGVGILPGDLERIFRGLERGDDSLERAQGGAGIGLALVRRLVELHGGRVWAESDGAGAGARFVVRLPRLEPPPPRRVLVVEDEPSLLRSCSIFLRDGGFAVEGAATGAAALGAIQADPPDLILLDIGLPDMSGWEVLRRIRGEAATQGIPVLVLTGLGEDQADQALALGADEFLSKPVSPKVLVEVAERLRRVRRPAGGP